MNKFISLVLMAPGALALSGCGSKPVASTLQNASSRVAARALIDGITGNARGARDQARTLKTLSDTRLAARDYNGAITARWEIIGIRGGKISPGTSLSSKAIQALALSDLEPIASHLDAPACRRFAAQLEALEARLPTYAQELGIKRDKEIKFFRRMSSDTQDWQKTITGLFKGQEQQTLRNTSPTQIENNINNVYTSLIANAKQPYSTPTKQVIADPYTKHYAVPFKMEKFLAARYQTDRLLTIAALWARADKLEHSPAAKLARDPFGNGPLRFKNGVIYSIGPDLKDDNGRAVPLAELRRESALGDLLAPNF